MAKKPTSEESPQFEQALADLEQIVRRLELGGSSLEDDLSDYGRAVKLIKLCHSRLTEAEKTVLILSGVDADGKPIVEPFSSPDTDIDENSLEGKRAERSRRRSARQDDLF